MTLAALYNIPTTQTAVNQFSFANADSHNTIIRTAIRKLAITLPRFVIDPIPLWDLETWARSHQDMHNAQNALLGIVGNDLTDINWQKQDELVDWIYLHANEHRQAYDILGITE